MKEANHQLIVCRRVLKYTYVFAFFHFADPKRKAAKRVFEHHQGQLERLTEGLSAAAEKSLEVIDQRDVVNQTPVIGTFIRNVVDSLDVDEH